MSMMRGFAVLVAMLLMATPVMAGNQPEYDAVGCDATNYFNDFIKVAVCEQGTVTLLGGQVVRINEYSDWTQAPGQLDDGQEYFYTNAGMLLPDPCFNQLCAVEYGSALTDPWNEGVYQWAIVLQKKPESDIDVNIRDCVLKHNTFDVWQNAEQAGRYRAPWGQLFFLPSANPQITVSAIPGPYATPGFAAPFVMDARTLPGLTLVALQDALYTTKALWEESLVLALPATGGTNVLGATTYNLKQGDVMLVEIYIPGTNSVDIFYGPDNVVVKYIGIVGTEYIDQSDVFDYGTGPIVQDAFCGACVGCVR